jgi:hypothetical protein
MVKFFPPPREFGFEITLRPPYQQNNAKADTESQQPAN